MSDTLQLFALAAVWTVISLFIARLLPNWAGRTVLFALLVGIPFWELPAGFHTFRKLCDEQAKLQILESFPAQESICVDDLTSNLFSRLIQFEFSRIEVIGRSDDHQRYAATGKVVFPKNRIDLQSKFCLDFEVNRPLPHRILRSATLVRSASDGRIVARQDNFFWIGMWWQDAANPLFGRGGVCFADPDLSIKALRTGRKRGEPV